MRTWYLGCTVAPCNICGMIICTYDIVFMYNFTWSFYMLCTLSEMTNKRWTIIKNYLIFVIAHDEKVSKLRMRPITTSLTAMSSFYDIVYPIATVNTLFFVPFQLYYCPQLLGNTEHIQWFSWIFCQAGVYSHQYPVCNDGMHGAVCYQLVHFSFYYRENICHLLYWYHQSGIMIQ